MKYNVRNEHRLDSLDRDHRRFDRQPPISIQMLDGLIEELSKDELNETLRWTRSSACSLLRSVRLFARATASLFPEFLGFSIVTNYRTYTLYLLLTTKATTNLVKRCDNVPQRFSFPPMPN